jgi:hypothetical protein
MAVPDSGEGSRRNEEIPPLRELYDVVPENWDELYAQGYRHALNIEDHGLGVKEKMRVNDFIREVLGGGEDADVLTGFPFDRRENRVLEHRKGAQGFYVKRPEGWTYDDS